MAIVCNCGKTGAAKRLNNSDSAPAYTYMSTGTGTTAEAATQTALITELTTGGFARAAATCSYEANYKSKWVHEFTNSSGGDITINELGIHNGSTPTASDILLRHKFTTGILVANAGKVEFSATVTVG